MLSMVIGLSLNACSFGTAYPVSDEKFKEDLTNYLKLSPRFTEVVLIQVTDREIVDDLFTITATVEYKDDVALIRGTFDVDYYKSDAAWVRKTPKLTVTSAIAYADPEDNDVLNAALGLNRSGIENRFDFNYYFEYFEITDKTVTLNENKALYEVTSEKTWWNCKATLTLGVDVRYTYEDGWKPIAIPYEHFTETTTWDGQYQIQLDEPVSGTSSFPITLTGSYEVMADSDGSMRIDGSIQAKFTLGGVDYDLAGGAWIVDDDTPTGRYLMFYYDQPKGKSLMISLFWAGHETDPYLVYAVNLSGATGTMTPTN